jgi:hypothetical protein
LLSPASTPKKVIEEEQVPVGAEAVAAVLAGGISAATALKGKGKATGVSTTRAKDKGSEEPEEKVKVEAGKAKEEEAMVKRSASYSMEQWKAAIKPNLSDILRGKPHPVTRMMRVPKLDAMGMGRPDDATRRPRTCSRITPATPFHLLLLTTIACA